MVVKSIGKFELESANKSSCHSASGTNYPEKSVKGASGTCKEHDDNVYRKPQDNKKLVFGVGNLLEIHKLSFNKV